MTGARNLSFTRTSWHLFASNQAGYLELSLIRTHVDCVFTYNSIPRHSVLSLSLSFSRPRSVSQAILRQRTEEAGGYLCFITFNMASQGSSIFLETANNTQDVQNWQAGIEKSSKDDFEGATKGISHNDKPETLLRRLSIIGRPHAQSEVPRTGPHILHPGSRVSGRIISAVFCVPFSIRYRKSAEWVSQSKSPVEKSMLMSLGPRVTSRDICAL